jgi:hypothetical protein
MMRKALCFVPSFVLPKLKMNAIRLYNNATMLKNAHKLISYFLGAIIKALFFPSKTTY